MKKILITTAFLLSSSVAALAAENASSTITLNGTVAPTCYISSSTGTITFGSANPLADSNTALIQNRNEHVEFANSYCNAAFKMKLVSTNGAITTTEDAVDGFSSKIDYTAKAQFGSTGSYVELDTSNESDVINNASLGAEKGTLNVDIVIAASQSTNPLLAGTYTDTLTVTIGTNL